MIDPRLTPARRDVAAAHLKGKVEAARFVEGAVRQVKNGVSALRETPSLSSRLETQLLQGERFTVYDTADGWAWGQAERDGYVGYTDAENLSADIIAPTHRIAALRTVVFPRADIKSSPAAFLSMNAKVAVSGAEDRFAMLTNGGYAIAAHLTPIGAVVTDWVAAAELFLHTPYLWGGKDSFGIDCSGLVQTALETAGVSALRDTDLQEGSLGKKLDRAADDLSGLQRGDLVFWEGHVGLMRDATHLLHASGHHMMVVAEPLAETAARVARTDGSITSIRRL